MTPRPDAGADAGRTTGTRAAPPNRWMVALLVCGAVLGIVGWLSTDLGAIIENVRAHELSDGAASAEAPAAASDAPDDRDVTACLRITDAAQRYTAGELTAQGYAVELDRAAASATPGGAVARHAAASLRAFAARDAEAGAQARRRLVDACTGGATGGRG